MTGVIFFIAEPFHVGIVDREKFFIILRVRRTIVVELIAVKAHASHLEKHAAIQLIVDRIETFEHFFVNSVRVIVNEGLRLFSLSFFYVFVRNDISMAISDGKALSTKEVYSME